MTLGLFEGYGVELEYMLVDADTLDVRPLSDRVIETELGELDAGFIRGAFGWSNELVLHVLEIKTAGPALSLAPLAEGFAGEVRRVNEIAAGFGARLLGGAAHPWMDPLTETRLWPHEFNEVFEAYNRIFDCRGHGWSNLQSVHLNLPFDGDDQFGRLHAAVRVVLPLLPGLCASSPYLDGRFTGLMDARLDQYLRNQVRVPSINGPCIPEPVYTRADYERVILEPMYRDIAPLDPDGILQDEWLNSRGAIARFGRSAVEFRLMDVQECPAADLAIVTLVVEAVRALVEERFTPIPALQAIPTEPLRALLTASIRDAERAAIGDAERALWGAPESVSNVGGLWAHIASRLGAWTSALEPHSAAIDAILREGCLARRLVRAVGESPTRETLRSVYGMLADGLARNELFRAD